MSLSLSIEELSTSGSSPAVYSMDLVVNPPPPLSPSSQAQPPSPPSPLFPSYFRSTRPGIACSAALLSINNPAYTKPPFVSESSKCKVEAIEQTSLSRASFRLTFADGPPASLLSLPPPASTLDLCLTYLATDLLQQILRSSLPSIPAVAFVATGSSLPRKSGISNEPLPSPPCVPFSPPPSLTKTIPLPFPPFLSSFLPPSPALSFTPTGVSLTGLAVPPGVTLIVGPGFHGKSTLLQTLASAVLSRPPSDGRHYCATLPAATITRSEDGRSVSNTDVSPFVGALPTSDDPSSFSTSRASGSTSQASNVADALELGCPLLLVDEDTSAANFMSRDGRMRALIQDESLTPLLYRVSSLHADKGVSTVCVVGGNGDWLDVGDTCLLMSGYKCEDATERMRSVSRTFSYGHVEYGGRGVVHRLPWPDTGKVRVRDVPDEEVEVDGDTLEGELGRVEQTFGSDAVKRGCVAAVRYLLSGKLGGEGGEGYVDKLRRLEEVPWSAITEGVAGECVRPRSAEIGFALLRVRGLEMKFWDVEVAGRAEEEERKRKAREELARLWKDRR